MDYDSIVRRNKEANTGKLVQLTGVMFALSMEKYTNEIQSRSQHSDQNK